MSVLVLGRSGQLARALMQLANAHGVQLEAIGRPDVDLENADAVAALIGARKPRVVVNAAAYTMVDKAEQEQDRAHAVNALGPGAAAAAAAQVGARFIHVSTDYVFAGDKPAPYVETDPTGPLGAYGATKLEGERLVLAAHPEAAILRTAWVFDAAGKNFVGAMLRLARQREEVSVVVDELGCPTLAEDLADAILKLSERDASGIYHCAGAGETTRAAFAEEIFAQSQARGGPSARVAHITSAQYAANNPGLAKRPANSRLDCTKLATAHDVRLRDWRVALGACLDDMAVGGWRI